MEQSSGSPCGMSGLFRRRHVASKPLEPTNGDVAAMGGIDEAMALVGIDNQLSRDAEVAKRVPELVGLRRRTLAVAIAYDCLLYTSRCV